ncbi:MAG: P1 family peptidase [Candidatus Latescibacterota bacterium]
MKKLHQEGIQIGQFQPGVRDSIADVEGVLVGHVDVEAGNTQVGLSVIEPYPLSEGRRRLYIGRWALDGGGRISGLGVAEDFGTFSAPIAVVPAPAFGRIYEALIHQGIERDSGLSTDAGWPPLVMGMEDGAWNDARRIYESVRQRDLDRALSAASEAVLEGSVGIGHSLRAFGVRGGVGSASRRVGAQHMGAFVAANGGLPGDLRVNGRAVPTPVSTVGGPQEFIAVLATDAPLLPYQLRALAQRAALGASRCGLWNPLTRTAQICAFSTAVLESDASAAELERIPAMDDDGLDALFQAGAESVEAAILSALCEADPLELDGRALDVLDIRLLHAARQ